MEKSMFDFTFWEAMSQIGIGIWEALITDGLWILFVILAIAAYLLVYKTKKESRRVHERIFYFCVQKKKPRHH
jgi:hypothetical protein